MRCSQGGWALGDARFARRIAAAAGRRATPLPPGRPTKPKPDQRQPILL
jgi:hypothetical protein